MVSGSLCLGQRRLGPNHSSNSAHQLGPRSSSTPRSTTDPFGKRLAKDGDPGDESTCCDDDSVVGTARHDFCQFLEAQSEVVLDSGELEPEEVETRRLTVRASLLAELGVELIQKSGVNSDRSSFGHRSVFAAGSLVLM